MHPSPAESHRNYPLYTPGGSDKRWLGSGSLEEKGQQWVGGLMFVESAMLSLEVLTGNIPG
jgi:hypothetical protein